MTLRKEFERDVAALLGKPMSEAPPITDDDIAHMPAPMRRYMHFTGAVGQPKAHNYRLVMTGEFKMSAERSWMPIRAEQLSGADPAERLFFMKASMVGIPIGAYHRYVGPAATFRVRIASLVTVVDAKGPEMNQGETVTVLNDMCLLAPGALLHPALEWEAVDDSRAKVTFTNEGNRVSAELTFDESGAMTDFVSHDRLATEDGKTYRSLPWSTPVYEWGEVDGRMVPTGAEAVWLEESGPAPYARLSVDEVEYNVVEWPR